MCEDCHREYCCVHGRRTLRFWGLGGVSYPYCPRAPGALPGAAGGLEHCAPSSLAVRREYLEEQRAAMAQRIKWLNAELEQLGRS